MSAVAVAAFAVFSCCLLLGLRNVLLVRGSLRWVEQANRAPLAEPEPSLSFVILVPLLREQAIVERLLGRMLALDAAAVAELRVAFITTAREGDGAGSTAAVLAEALRRRADPRLVHVHCDSGTDTCKADQLNFAMDALGLAGGQARDVFVGVYDADSSPDPRTLAHIAARVRETPELRAIQQLPLYGQNLRDPAGARELYLMARPVHNLLFALTVEVPGMRRQPRVFGSPRRSARRILGGWLSHGLGHGQFFRLDLLTEFDAFQPPSCDTQLGHALAFCGTPIHPHPMLDVGETPESVGVLMRQGVVWFNSMNTFWRTRRHVERLAHPGYHRPAAWAMMARLAHSNLAWAVYPLLVLAALVYAFAAGRWLLAAYGVAAWAAYVAPVALILHRLDLFVRLSRGFEPVRELRASTKLGIVLMFGVEKLGSCISPWLWCAHLVRRRLRGTPITLAKTERAAAETPE